MIALFSPVAGHFFCWSLVIALVTDKLLNNKYKSMTSEGRTGNWQTLRNRSSSGSIPFAPLDKNTASFVHVRGYDRLDSHDGVFSVVLIISSEFAPTFNHA